MVVIGGSRPGQARVKFWSIVDIAYRKCGCDIAVPPHVSPACMGNLAALKPPMMVVAWYQLGKSSHIIIVDLLTQITLVP